MAGKPLSAWIGIASSLGVCAIVMLSDPRLQAQEDDASYNSPPRTRQGSAPSGSRLRPPAGDSSQRRPAGRPAEQPGEEERPGDPAILEVQKLTPELESILDNWEAKTSQIEKLKGSFVRTTYDNVFNIQKLAKGEFMYEAPDKGYYTFEGYNPDKPRLKIAKDGKPFAFEPDHDEKWYCTGAEIYQLNVTDRTYFKSSIPEENRGKNIIDGPLPFLFGMKKSQAVRRYNLELHSSNDREIRIRAYPKLQQDLSNYSEAEVILDAETYLPKAMKLVDSPGTKETVHLFNNVSTSIIKWPFRDPFRPNLIGFKPAVVDQPLAEEDQNNPEEPARKGRGLAPRIGPLRNRTAQQPETPM